MVVLIQIYLEKNQILQFYQLSYHSKYFNLQESLNLKLFFRRIFKI